MFENIKNENLYVINATVTTRINRELKKRTVKKLSEVGMTFSDMQRMVCCYLCDNGKLPDELMPYAEFCEQKQKEIRETRYEII